MVTAMGGILASQEKVIDGRSVVLVKSGQNL